MLDVLFNLHSIINNGLIPGGQNSSKRQTVSFCQMIPETKSIKILKRLTWMYHIVHNTCITHGRNTKTRYIRLISILRFGKDWHSIRLDRMQSSFKKHFQLIVFQKLLDWRLEKSYMRKHTCHLDHHQRSRYVTIGLKTRERFYWAPKIDNHKKKLLDKQNSSNQPNQSQNQSVIDQGNLINAAMQYIMRSRCSTPTKS